MTERSEDGNYLVRVRAQVMSRDDSTGGWVPLGGGGLSDVSVRRRARVQDASPPPDKPKHEYHIYGKRISDNSVVLSCIIKKDFEYNKVMPTFHHWRTGSKRFGLTFQAAADARAFDKGVRTAVEDLLDGFTNASPSMPLPKCPSFQADDDVFMTLDLPQDPKDSRSSTDSNSSGTADPLKVSRITYIGRDKPMEPPRQPVFEPPKGVSEYVQLQARHEYFYVENPLSQQPPLPPTWESPTALKKASPTPPPQPLSEVFKPVIKRPQHYVCRHCNEPFTRDQNKRGSCKYAPDTVRSIVHWLSCLPLVNCSMYHCAADSEGDFQRNPCRCRGEDEPSDVCARRWAGLTLLSLVVPCIWLYPPLKLCHSCGVRCGMWGGKHKATTEGA